MSARCVCVAALALGGCGAASVESDAAADARFEDAARPDGRVVRGPFASRVVSFRPGEGATYGHEQLPDIALGPPQGAGEHRGGTDVVSLGRGGEITLALDDVAVVDGPGDDFVVFENAFAVQGASPPRYWDELGEVSVSDDGATWRTFPCETRQRPHTGCAGWHPVHSHPAGGPSPTDPRDAGGDPFDLATVGLARARFVRVRDLATQDPMPPSTGFDLDAVAVLHGARLR